ncbi:ABC transporter ATP-binding protein [Paenibacillus sp. GCM10027626]|uniref:ABC transporter ATP-binding protein n=1 Tax=Paenibacillus sp. GCM10027626 TaxID=3273411 RepID=UPI003634F087
MGNVEFRQVEKFYKGEREPSVKDFNLFVEDGEFVVLVGPSGCGKSTTLRMLAGLEEVSGGEIYIADRFVNYISSKNRDIAMVFQNYALYPNLSVYENMALGLKLRKTAKYEVERRVNRAAKILEISHLLEKKPNQLSGGQKQRVALGRAIVREPQVFLMDEPLSNLDAKLRVNMRSEISRLQRELQTTTLYVTHDQTEAMTMGSRIVIMQGGRIQQVAAPQQMYDEPANLFVAGFIGSPPMNFLEGSITEDEGALYFETKSMKLAIPDKHGYALRRHPAAMLRQTVLGIRPEHIGLAGDSSPEDRIVHVDVELKELMGSDTFIYGKTGDHRLLFRTEAHTFIEAGERRRVALFMDRAHFFDKASGDSLLSGEAGGEAG